MPGANRYCAFSAFPYRKNIHRTHVILWSQKMSVGLTLRRTSVPLTFLSHIISLPSFPPRFSSDSRSFHPCLDRTPIEHQSNTDRTITDIWRAGQEPRWTRKKTQELENLRILWTKGERIRIREFWCYCWRESFSFWFSFSLASFSLSFSSSYEVFGFGFRFSFSIPCSSVPSVVHPFPFVVFLFLSRV